MRSTTLNFRAIIGATIGIIIIIYFFAPGLLFSSGPRPVSYIYKKAHLPHEDEVIDPSDCKAKNVKELMKGPMSPVDRRLIKVLRKFYLNPPSDEPYNLADEEEGGPAEGLSDIVLELLNNQRDGFFIESRVRLTDKSQAKFLSNTIHLEKEYGWKGVIIEPDKDVYELLKTKNRKAWIVPAILSPNIYPQLVGFFPEFDELLPEDIEEIQTGLKNIKVVLVQGFPIVTIIAALKVRKIDYMSLSAQGKEYEILNTIPYDKIHFKVITIEHAHNQGVFDSIKILMGGHGFIFVSSIVGEKHETSIFAHPTLFE